MLKKREKKKRKGKSVQDLLEIKTFTPNGLQVGKNTLVFFNVQPTNVSVLSYENMEMKIRHLMLVLSAIPDIEIVCADSSECFDSNKSYLKDIAGREENIKVKELLEKDFEFLDNINTDVSTARQFMFILRCRNNSNEHILQTANRVEKTISDQNFDIKRLGKSEIKRFLAIYFGTSLYGESISDVDGEEYLDKLEKGG